MNVHKTHLLILLLIFTLLSCSKDDSSDDDIQVEDTPVTLEGDYIGTWNSDTDLGITYADYGISAKFNYVNVEETRLTGDFFATTTFNSCCQSGENDGTMIIDLDGETITSFSFDDRITNCTGTFSGTGSVISSTPYTLQIDFTGTDCDGNHIGQMIFRRINN